jgi:hypothetical protein
MSELTPKELVEEIKDLYTLLSSLEGEIAVEAVAGAPEKVKETHHSTG